MDAIEVWLKARLGDATGFVPLKAHVSVRPTDRLWGALTYGTTTTLVFHCTTIQDRDRLLAKLNCKPWNATKGKNRRIHIQLAGKVDLKDKDLNEAVAHWARKRM